MNEDIKLKTTIINCLESYVKKYQDDEKCIENGSLLEGPYMIGYFEAKDILNLYQQLKQSQKALNEIREYCKNDNNFILADLYSQDIADEIQKDILGILSKRGGIDE